MDQEQDRSLQQTQQREKPPKRAGDIAATVIMIVLSVILIPVLAINLTLIIKGNTNDSVPPDVFAIAPLAVTSPSMNGGREDSFDEGALIFVRILDEEEKQSLAQGDIVTFRATDGAYVTHRIVSLNYDESGALTSVITRGDANAATDGTIPLSGVVGICTGSVAGLGGFAMFLQTPVGILVFIGIPVLIFIAYDVTRILLHNRRVRLEAAKEGAEGALEQKESELADVRSELRDKDEEIRRLRALVEAKEKTSGASADREEHPSGDKKE